MKFRKCTDKYLNLKKRQYIKVAKYVSDIIEHIDMKPCKGTFEIVKEITILITRDYLSGKM